jgi:hypothetical protein
MFISHPVRTRIHLLYKIAEIVIITNVEHSTATSKKEAKVEVMACDS